MNLVRQSRRHKYHLMPEKHEAGHEDLSEGRALCGRRPSYRDRGQGRLLEVQPASSSNCWFCSRKHKNLEAAADATGPTVEECVVGSFLPEDDESRPTSLWGFYTINSDRLTRIANAIQLDGYRVSRHDVREILLSPWGEPGQQRWLNEAPVEEIVDRLEMRL